MQDEAGVRSVRTPVLGAALATAIALAILITLGLWQLHRLAWKNGLVAQIDAAETAPPRPLGDGTPPLFTRVTAHGTLAGGPTALYGAEVHGNQLGAQLVERLDRAGAPPLIVVLGWVPTGTAAPVRVAGPADITGYVRLPEHPTWLSAPDDPQGRHFYTLDPAVIGPALGAADAAPFILVALGKPPIPYGRPIPADTLPHPTNNHLQYALTWFGLAGALAGVFGVWVARRP